MLSAERQPGLPLHALQHAGFLNSTPAAAPRSSSPHTRPQQAPAHPARTMTLLLPPPATATDGAAGAPKEAPSAEWGQPPPSPPLFKPLPLLTAGGEVLAEAEAAAATATGVAPNSSQSHSQTSSFAAGHHAHQDPHHQRQHLTNEASTPAAAGRPTADCEMEREVVHGADHHHRQQQQQDDDSADDADADGKAWQYALVTCSWLFKPCPGCSRAHGGREVRCFYSVKLVCCAALVAGPLVVSRRIQPAISLHF